MANLKTHFKNPFICAQKKTETRYQRKQKFCLLVILSIFAVGSWSLAGEPVAISTGGVISWGNPLNILDPVSAGAGAYHFDLPLLSLGGPMNLGFTLRYRSEFDQIIYWKSIGVPHRFWWTPLEYMEWGSEPFLGSYATIQIANGDVVSFIKKDGQWVPPDPSFPLFFGVYPIPWTLQETDSYFYLMDPIGQQLHIFEKVGRYGRIVRIMDRNDNQLIYHYAGAKDLMPSRIEDGLGRSLDFTYQTVGDETVLVRVTDQAGRQISLNFEEKASDNNNAVTLRSVTDCLGKTTTFHYTWVEVNPPWVICQHQIVGVERPVGNVPYSQSYEIAKLHGSNRCG